MEQDKPMTRTKIGFVSGSTTEKIYKFIVSKRAVTCEEIETELKGTTKRNHIPSYLKQLIKYGLVIKSKERAKSRKRKCSGSFVWGVNEEAIHEKLYGLNKKVDEKELLTGVKEAIYNIINNSVSGFTTSEILYELRAIGRYSEYSGWDYTYTCLRELIKATLIKRSQFKIPDTCMLNGRKPGFVYGRDSQAIANKVISLMPPEVKDAFLMIFQSNDLHTIDTMEEKFKVTYEQVKSWFDIRLCTVGWLNVYSYKTRRYYYNPKLPMKYVEENVPKMHENQIVSSILNGMSLGREFERQAIYYFVMYLITRYGLQIRLNEDFPKNIPSWFNPKDIEKYTVGGQKNFQLTVDVWKFDSEPIDYLVFCYDEILKVPMMGYAISMKRDHKSHMLGNAGKNYIASLMGCISKGFTLDVNHIPCVNSLTPVIIMNNPNGIKLFEWARKCGCILLYSKTMERLIEHVNSFGFKYENDLKLTEIKKYKELFEQYKDHRDVVLGKVKIDDLVKLRKGDKG